MSLILTFAVALASLTIFIYILLIILWQTHTRTIFQPLKNLPNIAVLLAARNEEKNISRCIEGLLALKYPVEKVQIWIGNDDSSDNTGTIARKYAQRYDRIQVIDIKEKLGKAEAKANVLAHLIRASASAKPAARHLLITDADTQVNPGWAVGLLQHAGLYSNEQKSGVITGVTLIQGKSIWARMQCIDWLMGLGMVKVASEFGKPITTLGSNMMVSREAYEATGGYERMPFSITEDYALLHETFNLGYHFCNGMDEKVVAESLPIASIKELLQQRVRWMHGAMQLPWVVVVLLFIMAFFYPLLFFIAFTHLWAALGLFFLKISAECIFVTQVMQRLHLNTLRRKNLLAVLPLYEFYAAALSAIMIMFYFLPVKVRWKGRIFQ